jgi:SMC interacting uncharacterized protein involved in chromosome segregation
MTNHLPGTAPLTQSDGDNLRVSLKEYIVTLIFGLKEQINARIDHLESQIERERVGIEKRMEGMNEFRGTLQDQASRFASKSEIDAHFESRRLEIDGSLKSIRIETMTELEGLRREIKSLNTFRDTMEGKATQSSVDSVRILTIITLGIAILGIILGFIGK